MTFLMILVRRIFVTRYFDPNHYAVYMALVHALIASENHSSRAELPVDSVAQAIILLKSLVMYSSVYNDEYQRLCLAVDSSANLNQYTSATILKVFENDGGEKEHLTVYSQNLLMEEALQTE